MLASIVAPCAILSLLFTTVTSLPLRIMQNRQDTSSTQPARPKLVVAHHMVGNTFPYTSQDWEDDIALASANGIDGFALNYGPDEWQPAQLDNAYAAALKFSNFSLFLSMDMAVLPCSSPDDAQALRSDVLKYANHPKQLKVNGKAFVSTFAGESCTFGQSSVALGWSSQFSRHPDINGKIVFVPTFFSDPAQFSQFADVMDGDFNWNGGWPIDLTLEQLNSINSDTPSNNSTTSRVAGFAGGVDDTPDIGTLIGSTSTDENHLQGLAAIGGGLKARQAANEKRLYMASVSPWFFTHFGQDTFNKNFMFLADEHLYARRWESLIAVRDSVDIVQILTWNDWGESSYVSPIKGALPQGSEQWVDGMPHDGFLSLTKYYAEAFKTGQDPVVTNDTIVLVSRPHPVQADAPDSLGRPKGFELTSDKMWATILLKEPADVELSTSPENVQATQLPAGISKLSIPISAGGTMSAVIKRNGTTILETTPTNFTFSANPEKFNFNAFVLSAST
ncbi:glycoside hydrolase family 71 protein [Flagelloscypha sp. PMI_526]|nr:glycoside hydrolase family 71 protein [Flagelloscypha sp. PMI_526]